MNIKMYISFQFSPNGCVAVLCANKIDLPVENHQIQPAEYTAFALEHSLNIYEASAVTGQNVQELFEDVSRTILHRQKGSLNQVQRSSSTIQLSSPANQHVSRKGGACC